MNSDIAFQQLQPYLADFPEAERQKAEAEILAILEALAAASVENGKTLAFEELRHLIGAATQPGR